MKEAVQSDDVNGPLPMCASWGGFVLATCTIELGLRRRGDFPQPGEGVEITWEEAMGRVN
jgi:hypothetical protein